MRHTIHTVFDEFIPKGTTSSTPVYTGAQHNSQLGRHNQLGVHAVFDNVTTTAGGTQNLLCFLDVSNDGRNWIQRSNQASNYSAADADLTLQFTSTSNSVQVFWSDACEGKSLNTSAINGPLLGFVRIHMFFDLAAPGGHLRMTVVQRDT